jgi:hypothetical protein
VADPQPNYDYAGIGNAEALLIFSALAASPAAPFTNGVLGKITFWSLGQFCTWLASKEVLVLNIASTDLQTLAQKGEFNATFDEAFKAIHGNSDRLTAEQKAAIDAPVIAAFRKFAVFGQLRDSSSP